MHKVKKQVGWQVSRPLTQRLELCVGHPLDVRKAKAPLLAHMLLSGKTVFSLTSSGSLVARGCVMDCLL